MLLYKIFWDTIESKFKLEYGDGSYVIGIPGSNGTCVEVDADGNISGVVECDLCTREEEEEEDGDGNGGIGSKGNNMDHMT